MAELSAQDVVNQNQSVDESSSIDVSENLQSSTFAGAGDGWSSEAVEQLRLTNRTEDPQMSSLQSPSREINDYSAANATQECWIFRHLSPLMLILSQPGPDGYPAGHLDALVNGDSLSVEGSEDTGYQHSVGVDTDTDQSKGDANEHPESLANHVGSNSIAKKPTSFKPVSVTKNYLAKTGASPAPPAKPPTDKPSVPGQTPSPLPQASKPRLVAKSGRDARSILLAGGPVASTGPDASKVWNKNRPVPPPQPKQFTDEELKQQYGIHMATRLQADEAGKESKWADIDDDEEDWAPETVEWMDGTKSTIMPSENQPATSADGQRPVSKGEEDEASRTASAANRLSSIASIGKTILRPGARTQTQAQNQTKPGLVLKNNLESPSPAAPAPTTSGGSSSRSPWAPIAPVDKVAPVTFNPLLNQAPPPAQGQGVQFGRDGPPPMQSPTREIAADDFDRSWRETDKRSRELFNSQSGRYEPVRNVRRWSRQEPGGFRPPSLLQRPSPQSPGEYGRGSEMDQRYWARRDSSSVDGSGPNAPNALPKTSSSNQGDLDPQAGNEPSELSHSSQQPESPSNNSRTYSAHGSDSQAAPPPSEGAAFEDAHVVQQRLMRERIERNRKRKQEEEALEEAAKRERIRQKMEALGPALAKDEKAAAKSVDTASPTDGSQGQDRTAEGADTTSARNSTREASAKDTEPTSRLETQTSQASVVSPDSLASTHPQPAPAKASSGAQPLSKSLSEHDRPTSMAQDTEQLPGLAQVPPIDRATLSRNHAHPTLNQPSGWTMPSASQATSSRNRVWGPPSNDRTLGNGSFESDFKSIPSIQLPSAPTTSSTAALPGPIAPPYASPRAPFGGNGSSPTPSPIPNPRQLPTQENVNGIGSPVMASAFDSSHQQQRPSQSRLEAAKAAWKKFPSQLQGEEKLAQEKALQEHNARAAEEERTGIRQNWQPVYRETFRQTVASDALGQRQVVSVSKTTHDGHGRVHDSGDAPATSSPSYSQQPPPGFSSPAPSAPSSRASRFFGPGSDLNQTPSGVRTPQVPQSPGSPSPPPPEVEEHPVYGGNPRNPLVKMPISPRVKLPPAPVSPVSQPEPTVLPPRMLRSGPQPIVNQAAWQDRFNGLFGRKTQTPTSPQPVAAVPSPSTPVQAIASSSKTAFDVFPKQDAATVSLPQWSERLLSVPFALPDGRIESRLPVEELMDERLMGDKPTVKVPRAAYTNEPIYDTPTPNRFASNALTQMETSPKFSCSALDLSFDYVDGISGDGIKVYIRILGSSEKSVTLPRKFARDATRPQRGNRTLQKKRVPSKGSAGPRVSTEKSATGETGPRNPTRNPSKQHTTTATAPASARPSGSSATSSSSPAVQQTARKQSARSEKWPKPPRGRTSSGINPARI